jgi:hypothetical protein
MPPQQATNSTPQGAVHSPSKTSRTPSTDMRSSSASRRCSVVGSGAAGELEGLQDGQGASKDGMARWMKSDTEEVALNAWLVANGARPGFQGWGTEVVGLARELDLEVDHDGPLFTLRRRGTPLCADIGKFLGYVCWDHDIHDHSTPAWPYEMVAERRDGERVSLWTEVCKRRAQRKEVDAEYQRRVDACQRLLPQYRVYCVVRVTPISHTFYSLFDYEIRRITPLS